MGNFLPAEENLQRRTIFCDHPPDLPFALVAIMLHSNKINTNLLKEK